MLPMFLIPSLPIFFGEINYHSYPKADTQIPKFRVRERPQADAGNKFGGESFIVVIVFLFLVFVLLQHPESTG